MSDDALSIEINFADVEKTLERTKDGFPRLIDEMAIELRANLRSESAGASKRLTDSWTLDQMGDLESKVASAFFAAGWLARGTKGHGPKKAARLVFAIDGQAIRTKFVTGIKGDPFDERAIATTQAAMPSLLDRLILEAEAA